MNAHCEALLKDFREYLPVYKKIQEIVVPELIAMAKSINMITNSIESRLKSEESLIGKLELKGDKYVTLNDITDIFGARIVTFYSGEVDKISSLVQNKFSIDWQKSIDKRKIYSIDRFGYMSVHFICRIPTDLYFDEKYPEINTFPFEIQIRTTLQHTWASIYHDTGYKSDIEIPKEYLRSLNRLAGLLELADDEFERIKNSINSYRRKVKSIVASGDFKEVELNGDSFDAYCNSGPFDELNERIAAVNNMEISQSSLYFYLKVLKIFGFKTLGDVEKFKEENTEEAFAFTLRQLTGTDLDIISSTIGLQSLCFVYALKKGMDENGIAELLNVMRGHNPGNLRFAKRVISLGKDMGLVK